MQINKLATVFQSLPVAVAILLCATRPSSPKTIIIILEIVAPKIFSTKIFVVAVFSVVSHVSYMTIPVLVCKRGKTGSIARPHKKRYSNIATEAATATVKDEDVMAVTEAKESSDLSSKAMAAHNTLLQTVRLDFCVYPEVLIFFARHTSYRVA